MSRITAKAYAKLNLSLDVTGTRPDGYHEMCMLMQSVDLCDEVKINLTRTGEIRVRTNFRFLPSDGRNIAVKAARAFFDVLGEKDLGADITLKKRIPVCAGLGGGSSDAAAVLRALNRMLGAKLSPERLEELGRGLGSDVPFCIRGGTQLAEGRGDELRILPALPDCVFVICKPPFSVSTPELFRHVDERRGHTHPDTEGMLEAIERGELRGVTQRLYNVFEDVPGRHRGAAAEIKSRMLDLGAMGTAMSGTGPSVFGVFENMEQAEAARKALSQRWRDCFAACPAAPEL